jgi:hypothetical protein
LISLLIGQEGGNSIHSVAFRNSLTLAVHQALPEVKALPTIRVFNSSYWMVYILLRKYESSPSEGDSPADFEFTVASSCSSGSSQPEEGSCSSEEEPSLPFRKNF